VGLWLEWIPEEDQTINSTFCDTGADLLVATQWTAVELADLEPELTLEQLASGAGRVQLVCSQEIAIEAGPLQQIAFLVVVRDQCNVSGAWLAADVPVMGTPCGAPAPSRPRNKLSGQSKLGRLEYRPLQVAEVECQQSP